MTAAAGSSSQYSATLARSATVIAAVAAPLAMVPATQSLSVTIPLAALLMAAAVAGDRPEDVLAVLGCRFRSWVVIALAVLIGFAGVSLAWTQHPAHAAGELLALAGIGIVPVALAALWPPTALRGSDVAFALGIGVLTVVLAIEVQFDSPIRRLFGAEPEFGKLVRPLDVAAVLVFPALAALGERRGLAAILVLAVMAAVVPGYGQAATLGLIIGLAVFAVGRFAPSLLGPLLATGAVAALLAAPIVLTLLGSAFPDSIQQLLHSASVGVRLAIWHDFSQAVWNSPIWGSGFGASRYASVAGMIGTPADPVPAMRSFVPGHTHSAALQIWFELGLVGALLGAAIILALVRVIVRLPAGLGAPAGGCFAAAFTIAFFGHGAWQTWWFPLLGLAAAEFAVLAERNRAGIA